MLGMLWGLAGCAVAAESDLDLAEPVAESAQPDQGVNGGPTNHCAEIADCPPIEEAPVCAMWLCDITGAGDGSPGVLPGCYLAYAPPGDPCPLGSGFCMYVSPPAAGPEPRHAVGICAPLP